MKHLIVTTLLALCLMVTGCGENKAEQDHRFKMEELKLQQETTLKKATIEAERDMEVAEDYSDAGISANGQVMQGSTMSQGNMSGQTVESGYSGTDMLLAAGAGALVYDAFKPKSLDFQEHQSQYGATRGKDFNGFDECLDKNKKAISCKEADRRIAQSKKDKAAYDGRKAKAQKLHNVKEADRKKQYNKNKNAAEAKKAQKGKAAGKQNSQRTAAKNCPKNTVLDLKTNKCKAKSRTSTAQVKKQKPAPKKKKKKVKRACGKKNGKTVYCYK
jgi:hypothetical protein